MNFKYFLNLIREEKKAKAGTYIMAEVSKESQKELFDWVNRFDIPNKSSPDEYHSTIIYSRKHVDGAEDYKFDDNLEAKIVGWKIFGTKTDKKCLVGIVNSKRLTEYHEDLVDNYGATHDFPEYHPHITVSYDYGDKQPPLTVPRFKITYDNFVVKPLDLDFTPKTAK